MLTDSKAPFVNRKSGEYDVVIIGGGITGCGIARALSPDLDTLVLEKGEIGSNASGLSLGLLSPSQFLYEVPDAAAYATKFFDDYDGTEGFRFIRRPRVGLIEPDLEAEFRQRAQVLASRGFPTSFLESKAVEDKYPQFDMNEYSGAIEYRSHGWTIPYDLTVALKKEAEKNGAEFRPGAEVEEILSENGHVKGVSTGRYTVTAEKVVSAAGWMIPELLDEDVSIPLRPWRYELVTVDPGWDIQDGFPIGHAEQGLTFRPRENGNLAVGTDKGGFEQQPEETTKGGRVPDESIEYVLRELPKILPEFDEVDILSSWTGAVGMAPDSRPIVDQVEKGPEGLFIAFPSGAGILANPVMQAGVRSLIMEEQCPFNIENFSLDRFESLSAEFDSDSMPVYFQK